MLQPGVGVMGAQGQGVSGMVGDRKVSIGGWRYLADRYPEAATELSDLRVQHPDAELRASSSRWTAGPLE